MKQHTHTWKHIEFEFGAKLACVTADWIRIWWRWRWRRRQIKRASFDALHDMENILTVYAADGERGAPRSILVVKSDVDFAVGGAD